MTRTADPLERTHDAVLIVPGIMGSELRDVESGRTIWGTNRFGWYVRAWTTGAGLDALRLTDAERAGRYGRVRATRLLQSAAFFRVFAGLSPYRRLVRTVRDWVVHDDAVLEFAYDWRLPVAYNARLLAEAADRHLTAWRAHPAHAAARRDRPARLVFVAHSMGGLLVRELHRDFPAGDIRATCTLGTPFYGSVKAVALLNSGRGAPVPLPARRPFTSVLRPDADEGLRSLVRGLPGVHDLLPVYKCLTGEKEDPRRPDAADVAALGGDKDLAADSFAWQQSLSGVRIPHHRAVVGVRQPTAASYALVGGEVAVDELIHEGQWAGSPRRGDGTVYRESAALTPDGINEAAQQHGALPAMDEVLTVVSGVLTGQDPERFGPPLGVGDLGVELPDVVLPDERVVLRVVGTDDPREPECHVFDAATGRPVGAPPRPVRRDGVVEADLRLPQPGLYGVRVTGGSGGPVEQLVLVADPRMDGR